MIDTLLLSVDLMSSLALAISPLHPVACRRRVERGLFLFLPGNSEVVFYSFKVITLLLSDLGEHPGDERGHQSYE